MELIDAIQQRKTIKMFQRGVNIPREEIMEMLTLAQFAPSKANLQPWRFVVIDETEQKKQLLDKVAFNAPPCESASAVIMILADLHYEKLLDDVLDNSIASGCLHPGFRENSYNFLLGVHNSLSQQEIRDQVLIDSSLVAMQLMLIIKEKGYDSHAIGIFDRKAVLETLAIDSERYAPVMLLAIGKAAVPALPSARLSTEYTVSWNNGQGFKK
ncbi:MULTISPECIES: nitroreductase family protein [Glaesserella]|uniref:Nitroreductase family protein n=1 Tax=Glaesserella australis TaxID=2094024 RepID=A0A328C3Q3_9PAST|nr:MULTISPECIES: nitroreductase family protein [Glaesserella]AUI66132.1 nitroreductase [Glaesserella sp. 15-184]RAL19154.1 nitroreductase family protein [Glaesserella australis]